MALKKQNFTEEEIPIFDEAVVYRRGEYWQFRMWLNDERKYARKSLRTRSQVTAIERGKEAYLEIYANLKAGKTYFSITTKEGVEKYLKYREKDLDAGLIVKERLITIKTHLQHWLNFIKKDTKLKELQRTDCENYFFERTKSEKNRVKQVTIQNEQSTINACMRYLFKNNETYIDGFDFKKLPRLDSNSEEIRRATFTVEEYEILCKVMRTYCARRKNKLDEDEWKTRQLVRHYILIAANSGLRVGEQKQLRWSDLGIEKREANGQSRTLAKISVRAATSKVRKSRIFYCRGGEYFLRIKKILGNVLEEGLIFSLDGKSMLSQRTMLYHFNKIIDLCEFSDRGGRDLVPYSLRHFMITQRIMSGLNFRQIADMCGTSVAQIEKTYYHLNDEIRVTNAVADYRRNKDGTITVI
jgi:integrase